MKKFVALLFLALSSSLVFSLDANYFKKNKGVDFLYVNSSEELTVRDKPSLSGGKIGTLCDRMKVKVISVGEEASVGGIKSNWVKILLPLETLKSNSNVYGWIFGAYLTDKLKPFSTKDWTDSDLQKYLCRFSWAMGERGYYQFYLDGTCSMGLLESGTGGGGLYTASMKNKTITVKARYGDEDSMGNIVTQVYGIVKIEEDRITLKYNDSEFVLQPSFTNYYFYEFLKRKEVSFGQFEEASFAVLLYPFASDLLKKIDGGKFVGQGMHNLIKMGIPVDSAEYKIQYDAYWK